ncbi:UNVERIFIED_CONTAM: hypothetical protein Sradi_0157100 [Sesamum radiatum]|uniref:Uncharacterized protein n=1 Tax=Sesamum radiatum TaxID=300843 RepID=A0AAW2WK73_SESRA
MANGNRIEQWWKTGQEGGTKLSNSWVQWRNGGGNDGGLSCGVIVRDGLKNLTTEE